MKWLQWLLDTKVYGCRSSQEILHFKMNEDGLIEIKAKNIRRGGMMFCEKLQKISG